MRVVLSILLAVFTWLGLGIGVVVLLPLFGSILQLDLPYRQIGAISSLLCMGIGIFVGITYFRSQPQAQEIT